MSSPPLYNVYPGSDGVTNVLEILSSRVLGVLLDYQERRGGFIIKSIDHSVVNGRGGLEEGDLLVSVNGHNVLEEALEDVYALLQMISIRISADVTPRRFTFLSVSRCSISVYQDALDREKKKDKFGFRRNLVYLIKEDELDQAQDSKREQKRDEAFVGYLKKIGGIQNLKPAGMCSDELAAVIRRGVPIAYRGAVWSELSMANHYRRSLGTDYYQLCLERADTDLPSQVRTDVEKDVDRTFPDHDHFRSGGGEKVLRRVLMAYAIHNGEVGYCQGLNFVAGVLLLYCGEEEAFFILLATLDSYLPPDYYSKALLGHQVDQMVLDSLVKECFPALSRRLEGERIQLALVTVSWFLPLFTNTLRHEVSLRVLDVFFAEGCIALFKVALALFQLNEAKLLSTTDHSELFMCLRELGGDITSADDLMAVAFPPASRPSSYSLGRSSSASPISGLGLAHLGFSEGSSPKGEGKGQSKDDDGSRGRSQSEMMVTTPRSGVIVTPGGSNGSRSRRASLDVDTDYHRSPSSGSDASNNGYIGATTGSAKVSPSSIIRSLLTGGGLSAPRRDLRNVLIADVERLRQEYRPGLEENLRYVEELRRESRERERALEAQERERQKESQDDDTGVSVSKRNSGGGKGAVLKETVEGQDEDDHDDEDEDDDDGKDSSVDSDDQIDAGYISSRSSSFSNLPPSSPDANYHNDGDREEEDLRYVDGGSLLYWLRNLGGAARCDVLL